MNPARRVSALGDLQGCWDGTNAVDVAGTGSRDFTQSVANPTHRSACPDDAPPASRLGGIVAPKPVGTGNDECMPGPIDDAAVSTFLTERFGEVQNFARLRFGEWSAAYAFTTSEEDLVVRLGAYREDYEKDRLASGWAGVDLPIPNVCEIGEALGGFYAISTRMRGVALDDLPPADLRGALPSLFGALGAVGRAELAGSGYGVWSAPGFDAPHPTWADFLTAVPSRRDERVEGWHVGLARESGAARVFDRATRAIEALAPRCGARRNLVHGDLLAGNVLVLNRAIAGVLDWGNALAGDPLYDFAWLVFWSPWHPGLDRELLVEEARRSWDDENFDARFRCYLLHVGVDGMQYDAATRRFEELRRASDEVSALLDA